MTASTGGHRVARVVLPIALIVLLTAALYPACSTFARQDGIASFLPATLRQDHVKTVPGAQIWQSSQVLQPALDAFGELPSAARRALGYGDDLDAPELHGEWLIADLVPAGGDGSLQTIAFGVEAGRITLQSVVTPRSWTTFTPGLPVLDDAVLAGSADSWSGTATLATGGEDPSIRPATAAVSTAPTAGQPDCVDTTIRFSYRDGDTETRMSRWCRGQQPGWAGDLTNDKGVLRTSATPPQQAAPDLTPMVQSPPAPTGEVRPVDHYRLVNDALTRVSPGGARHVDTAGPVLVMTRADGRVESWAPVLKPLPGATEDYLRWRALPRGQATALTTVGSVTVVADASNQVTAWSDDGWRLWQRPTVDLVAGLIALDRSVLVWEASDRLSLLDGASGAERWSRDVPDTAAVAASGAYVAVVADQTLTVLDARTGEQRWHRALGGDAPLVMVGDLVVVRIGSWLVARSAGTGAVVWWRSVEGAVSSMTATSQQIVLVSGSSTRALDRDGRVRWSTAPAHTTCQEGDLAALAYSDHVELWGPGGRLESWSYPPGYGVPDHELVITGHGLRLYQPGNQGSQWWEYR